MIDNRLNSETAAKLWEATAEFLKRKGCKDKQHRNSYMLYLYASGKTMNEIAEELNLSRERVRQILVGEINSMTRSARMNGYFALQEKYDQLKEENELLLQQLNLLQAAAKKRIPKFTSLAKMQVEALNTTITEMGLSARLHHKLQSAGFANVGQIVLQDTKSLTAGRVISPTDTKMIEAFLSQHGLKLGMTSQEVAKIRQCYETNRLSKRHPEVF